MVQLSQRKDKAASDVSSINTTQPTEHHPRMTIVVETNYQVHSNYTQQYYLLHLCSHD
jgi:hypothetical protein